jgi:hypothetical protein
VGTGAASFKRVLGSKRPGLSSNDLLPIASHSEIWPIRDDSHPVLVDLDFDLQRRSEISLHDEFDCLIRLNIVFATPRFENDDDRSMTSIRNLVHRFSLDLSRHGVFPSSVIIIAA